MDPSPDPIRTAHEALKQGQLVAVPTETVYGLAAHALNPDAVRKIFEVKGRPLIDPLIVHVYNRKQLEEIAEPSPHLDTIENHFWPGPLTVILKKKNNVPDIVTAGLPSIAIRMPAHPIFRSLLKACQFPLAAPSANPFGYISPTESQHVKRTLGNKIALILEGGPSSIGIESTIIDLTHPQKATILRPGPISAEELEAALRIPVHSASSIKDHKSPQIAPGMLSNHYSPTTPLFTFKHKTQPSIPPSPQQKIAIIFNQRPTSPTQQSVEFFWLSEAGHLHEMAQNLFSLLQRLDLQGFQSIYIEKVLPEGIGIAINNRIERAAH